MSGYFQLCGVTRYLRIALDIDNRKVGISLWVLVEKCYNSFDSLNPGTISVRVTREYQRHEQPCSRPPPFPWSPYPEPSVALSSGRACRICGVVRCLPGRVPESHVTQSQPVTECYHILHSTSSEHYPSPSHSIVRPALLAPQKRRQYE